MSAMTFEAALETASKALSVGSTESATAVVTAAIAMRPLMISAC